MNSFHTKASDAGLWFIYFFICARINDLVTNDEAGDLRRHRATYDVIVMIDRLDLKLNRYKRSMKPQRFIKFHFDHGKDYLKIYILTLKRPQNIHVSLFGNLLIYIDAIWWIGYIFFATSLPMMRRLRTWQLWGVQLRRPSYPLRMVIDIDQLAIRSLSGSIGDDRGLFDIFCGETLQLWYSRFKYALYALLIPCMSFTQIYVTTFSRWRHKKSTSKTP